MSGRPAPEPAARARAVPAQVISFVSARPDGATTLAVGLAAVLSASSDVLLIDLNLERAEIGALLDLRPTPNLYHLAYQSRLGRPDLRELEQHLQWRDGMAVLAGIARSVERSEVTDLLVDGLVEIASQSFDYVVIDAGRVRCQLPGSLLHGSVLWVVNPRPLGIAALEATYSELSEAAWLRRVQVVINQGTGGSLSEVGPFLTRAYGLEVAGKIPAAPGYWESAEISHSVRALSAPLGELEQLRRAYGAEALATRQSLSRLAEAVAQRQAPPLAEG